MKSGDIIEGRYRLISILGEGAMGTVFLAEHILIQRRLALKLLHAQLAEDISIVERFMNEARAAGTLGHPNIVESTDMGFTRENVPYIVFEYLQGSTLTDEIYRVGGLSVRRALRIAHQIASALDAAHNAGIVHRDLKSDNVFLTDREDVSDHVKVLDFGVSRFSELESDRSGGGQVLGTPEYMAPEQVTSPDKVDARADIYGLGVILYEMLTARCPFRADDDPHAVLHQVVNDPPPPLGLPSLPPGLQEMILSKLLAKDPNRRYATMKDVAAAIEAFHLIVRPPGSITPLSVPRQPDPSEARADAVVKLPDAPARLASPYLWLVGALVAGAAGVGMMVLGDQASLIPNTTSKPALEIEAQKIAAALENALHAGTGRAEGVATTPMLRAAIETDAATLKDMAGADFLFNPKPNETLEVFQVRAGTSQSLLRIPEKASAIPPAVGAKTGIQTDGRTLHVLVSVPVTTQNGKIGGSIALLTPVDLSSIKESIAKHAVKATLLGLTVPLELAAGAGTGDPITVPIAVAADFKTAPLSLSATISPPSPGAKRFWIARFVAWGFAGALFVLFLMRLLRGNTRG